jgi:hypothetical protein
MNHPRIVTILWGIALLAVLTAPADALDWYTQTVATGIGGGTDNHSVSLTPSGMPRIAYVNMTTEKLMYATPVSGGWQSQIVGDCNGNWIGTGFFEIDPSGTPHIAYRHDGDVWYATWNGSWQTEQIDTINAGYLGLAVDDSGNPHLAYCEHHGDIWHASKTGETWTKEVAVSAGGDNGDVAIDLNSAGLPRLAYRGGSGYAWQEAGTWNTEVIGGSPRGYYSLAISDTDVPHIAYTNEAVGSENLAYVTKVGGSWAITLVDDIEGQTGWKPSIALDAAQNPHISYTYGGADPDVHRLEYAWYDGALWHLDTVESVTVPNGSRSCLILDDEDNSMISFGFSEGQLDFTSTTIIPEPSTLLLLAPGLLGFAGLLLKRRK